MKPPLHSTSPRSRTQRWLAGLLAYLIALGPIATPSYAALTLLADEPLNVKNSSKPNIVLTVDDSTSMLYDFLPDYVVEKYCRDGRGVMSADCGFSGTPADAGPGGRYISPQYIWEQYAFPFSTYVTGYNESGPGAGCNMTGTPPSCSPGISPGALPGLATYPPASGSPMAGKPYEYWLMWPAPVHNSEFNHLYYNPRLTYDPPAYPDGTSYLSMSAGNTTNWTLVPADPWASTLKYANLAGQVTIGQWCNSDWTQGNDDGGTPYVTNPGHCRTNGLVGAASAGAPAAIGDYMYPWAPDKITPNDYNSKVDMGTIAVFPPVNAKVKPEWTAAQDPKYFYQNENVLWCDITSPDWPQSGPSISETCQNKTTPQICNANPLTPTCTGAVAGTCSGAKAAGTCSGAPSGQCTGYQANGQCGGFVSGVCTGFSNGVCGGGSAATCNGIPTCSGAAGAACSATTKYACNGASAATCGGMTAQTCNGGTAIACNAQSQSCNGAGAQTCANIVAIPPDPSTCTSAWDPPGCNLSPNPEGTCTYKTTCPPPTYAGKCSIKNNTCTSDADCPFVTGTCSIQTAKTCSTSADCSGLKYCQGTTNSCSTSADCGIAAGSGKCSATAAACTKSADCANAGTCTNPVGKVCTSNAQCNATSGTCAGGAGQSCTTSTNCDVVPNSGTCNYKNTGGTVNGACTTSANCQAKPNTCNNPAGKVCAAITDCTPGACVNPAGLSCFANATCTAVGNKCTNAGTTFGNACASNGACTVLGKCTAGQPNTTTCSTNANCNVAGACTTGNVGAVCNSTSLTDALCKKSGTCSTGNVGAVCNSTSATDVSCAKSGVCSNTGAVCTSSTQCGAVAGTCTTGKVGTCNVNADCNKTAVCGNSQNNGATCTTTANCTPLKGSCSFTTAVACTTATDCLNTGVCKNAFGSGSGNVCTTDAQCPAPNGPLDPRNARCDTTGVSGSALKTLLSDANGAGKACRRNNHAYPDGTTASQVNYPSGKFTTPVTGEIVPGSGLGCFATPRYANVPRHYWKTSVEWCDQAIGTAGDKWVGYGTPTNGSCQAFKDGTHVYPRFYQFGADPGTDNNAKAAFARVDLDIAKKATASYTHTWKDATGTTQTITRTFDEEMENYANWFAYYRTRIQAVKTVTSLVFKELDDRYRVGFHTLSNSPKTSFVDVGDFTAAQKKSWFDQLFGITVKLNQETPNLDAITRIGDYYLKGASADLAGATDPIVLSCQKNWHMLFTDGLTNQPKLPTTTVGNLDKDIPALPAAVLGLVPGTPWPPPYRENPSATSDSASDYITFYWVTDLRKTGPASANNVPISDRDPASWQHVNFAAMSLGTEGKLPAGNQSVTEDQLKAGTTQWPQPYPNVYKPDESGVDDLWHAAINGRGRFVNAQSADELKLGMGQILQDITNQAGARSGVAFENVNLSSSNRYVYRVRFEPGWGGSITKVEIDPTTGNEVKEIWRAADQLTTQLLVVAGVKDTPWFTERKIATMDSTGKAVPFLWGNLSGSQQTSLAAKATQSKAVLEFLRGNRTNEGTKIGQFRVRAGPLGDIVNSQAVFVGPPKAPYLDSNDPKYAAFKASNASRAGRVYVGANDGMLHAFDDSTGNETWAYVPLGVYRSGVTGLGALSYQDGALPAFQHHYYVDATPKVVDVDFGAGSGDWRTLLVGGLGKGGRSYFGIDITTPSDIKTENDLASKVVWEFSDPDMGYSYGKPVITKTHNGAWGGKWVAIIPSGYNNASGDGKLFFVDVATGKLLTTLSTGAGSGTTPSGLAHISGYTLDYRNQMTEQVYAGDLLGNFWRFDISDPSAAKWTITKLATLTDPGGTPQPVTTPPQIEIDIQNGVDRWVFVGTGKLYHDSDLKDTQTQTMYAIRDGTTTVPKVVTTAVTRSDLEEVKDADGLAGKPDNGWFDDLPSGQRIVVPPQAALSVVAYAGTSPQDDPCLTGQPATVYAREYGRGNSLITDDKGNIVESVYSAEGGVGLELLSLDNGGSEVPTIVVGLTLGTTGKLKPFNIQPPAYFTAHRMSWRLLGE